MPCQDATMLQFFPKRHTISMEESIASPSHLDMALNCILAVISLDYATIYCSSAYDFNGALICNTIGTVHSNNARLVVDVDNDMANGDNETIKQW
jgi:hypothetical protein